MQPNEAEMLLHSHAAYLSDQDLQHFRQPSRDDEEEGDVEVLGNSR